jgi:aspartate/methionine/tyrosine aminotransferase
MEELEMIADVCKKHDLLCISDEVYEWLVFNGTKHTRIGMHEKEYRLQCNAQLPVTTFNVFTLLLAGFRIWLPNTNTPA